MPADLQNRIELLKLLERNVPSTKEVAQMMAEVVRAVNETRKKLEQTIEQRIGGGLVELDKAAQKDARETERLLKQAERTLEGKIRLLERALREDTKGELDKLAKSIYLDLEKVRQSIPGATDLTDIYKKVSEVEGKIPLPATAEVVRDQLETLEGDERLDKSAIKGLEEELSRMGSKIDSKTTSGGGTRRVFQPHLDDFSGSTDGSTKTFTLSREPLRTDTILVWGTDFPIILRPTTDFTVAGKTLTLTSAVPAPSQGATLLIQYFA